MNFPKLEGDGLLEGFYEYLWKRSHNDSGKRDFFLPHTVIYINQRPALWYYSTNDKILKKKSSITGGQIEKAFLRRANTSGIVASFTYFMSSVREIEYFSEQDLHNFIHVRQRVQDGILQQFLDSKSPKNTAIKLIWSPKISLYECKESLRDLCDFRYNIYERAVTIEGQEHLSRNYEIKGQELKAKISSVTEKVLAHIRSVSEEIVIKRIVLLWKIDFSNRLCLLGAMSVRTKDTKPLDIASSIQLPKSVSPKNTIVQRTMVDNNPSVCKSCEVPVLFNQLYKLPYQYIIAFYGNKDIPRIIAKNHPKISKSVYKHCVKDSLFLKQFLLVCCDCYMKYTSGNLVNTVKRKKSSKCISIERSYSKSSNKYPKVSIAKPSTLHLSKISSPNDVSLSRNSGVSSSNGLSFSRKSKVFSPNNCGFDRRSRGSSPNEINYSLNSKMSSPNSRNLKRNKGGFINPIDKKLSISKGNKLAAPSEIEYNKKPKRLETFKDREIISSSEIWKKKDVKLRRRGSCTKHNKNWKLRRNSALSSRRSSCSEKGSFSMDNKKNIYGKPKTNNTKKAIYNSFFKNKGKEISKNLEFLKYKIGETNDQQNKLHTSEVVCSSVNNSTLRRQSKALYLC